MSYFAYPSMLLWLIVPLLAALLGAWTYSHRKKILAGWGHVSTVSRLLPQGLSRRRRWAAFFRVTGFVAIAVALGGPLLGSRLVEYHQKGLDIFIAVDTSLSMQAQDFQPSRMAHAKLILGQLIQRLAGSRVGIIAFAGQASVECPLTIDTNAAQQILDTIDVGSIPMPGTAIGDAIRVAIRGLKAGEGNHRALVLLTDGEDHHSDPLGAAKEAKDVGLKIFPVGIGSAQGEPIPMFDDQGHRTDYKRDKNGQVVLSKLDEKTLAQIADTTGGHYFRAVPTGGEIDDLLRTLDGIQGGDQKTKLFDRYENRYQWPLAFGLLCFLISLLIPEAGWRVVLLFTLYPLLFTTPNAYASPAQLKEGNRLFKNGSYEKALKLYEDALVDTPHSSLLKYNAGDAAYQSGDFPKASHYFQEADQSTLPALTNAARYNLGNALFRQNNLPDAIEAYKNALRANPNDEDARYNLSVALRQQHPRPSKGSGKNNQQDKKGSGEQKKNEAQQANPDNGQAPKPGQMSREDAERLLAAAGAGEMKKEQKQQKPETPKTDEDW